MGKYVTDLNVLVLTERLSEEDLDARTPLGWTRLDEDLNAGAGGDYLYFLVEKGDDGRSPVTGITFLTREQPAAPGYVKSPVDLNSGTDKGMRIYTAITHDLARGKPITDLRILVSDVRTPQPDPGYQIIPTDLNAGAGGKYIYLTYA
ncbi:hypothetical protein [Streptomyces cinnamoneus]|uniref:MABP domain-containing protein n=1 Tax=Streptomyces cinnamoneus TaxID=53446 RepID=A0A918TQK4_STRCJ|nr:hypothetical protein [Streptomyces cinnamoneus]GHC57510.1 hypothetical protein GCM10010507_37700 [Streptomyces cinnamoneus]